MPDDTPRPEEADLEISDDVHGRPPKEQLPPETDADPCYSCGRPKPCGCPVGRLRESAAAEPATVKSPRPDAPTERDVATPAGKVGARQVERVEGRSELAQQNGELRLRLALLGDLLTAALLVLRHDLTRAAAEVLEAALDVTRD